MRRHSHIVIRGILLFGLIAAYLWSINYPPETTRLKITATVDVNGTLYSGSAVQEYRCFKGGGVWGSMNVGHCETRGEAVVVDIKNRGYLFLTFQRAEYAGAKDAGAKDKALHPALWSLDTKEMPVMVMFNQINDPTSAMGVDPTNLHRPFGHDATLKTVQVAHSTEPITHGRIEQILPWINTITGPFSNASQAYSGNDNGPDYDRNIAPSLTKRDFIRDEY